MLNEVGTPITDTFYAVLNCTHVTLKLYIMPDFVGTLFVLNLGAMCMWGNHYYNAVCYIPDPTLMWIV